jgi:Carboxypeptidase regulatory-like domain
MGAGSRSGAVAVVAARLIPVIAGLVAAAPRPARAEQAAGDARGALPGFVRVGAAGPFHPGLVVSGLAGYGYRGAVVADSDQHHRAAFDVATSFRPLDWLAIAARISARYDRHVDTGASDDGGWVGDPRVAARASHRIGEAVWLAAQAGVWVPGRDAPSLAPEAASFDLIGLASWAPADRLALGAQAGFRLDRSDEAIDEPDELTPSDRLALGVSESHAVLLGLGASLRTGATEWVGEWSWDVLVGDQAPAARRFPMRVAAGVRRHVSATMELQFTLEYSLARSPGAMDDALFPVEPRVQALAGITFQPGRERERERLAVRPARTRSEFDSLARPSITIAVVGPDRRPVAGADVVLLPSDGSAARVRMGRTDAAGRAKFDDVDEGLTRVRITHRGLRTSSQLIEVEPGQPRGFRFALEPAPRPAQLRGVVRSWSGRPLAAELTVSPGGVRTRCDARGEFAIDLPPGDYRVSVRARGYRAQRRRVHIERDGVTILNVDLGR